MRIVVVELDNTGCTFMPGIHCRREPYCIHRGLNSNTGRLGHSLITRRCMDM